MNHSDQKFLGLPRAWLAVLCGAFFYSYQFVLRVSPNVMHDDLMRDFGIDATTFGTIISLYSWSYAGIQIPLGIALDRYGPGKLLSLAALLCAISCFLFALTTSPFIASTAMFLMGLGSAGGFLGSIKLGTTWFAPKHLAKVIALIMIFGTIGAGLGGTPLSLLIEHVGWQKTLHILGLIGLCISFLMYLIVGRTPIPLLYEPQSNIFAGIRQVLGSAQAWLISLYSMLMYAPITIMGVAWGVPFVNSVYPQIDEKVAATVITTMFVGAAMGSPFFSLLSDKIHRRNLPMMIGAVLSLLFYLVIIYGSDIPLSVMYLLFFAAGFAYTAKSLSFASICETMPQSSSAVSVGFINTVVMSTGVVFHPLMGTLLENHWDGTIINGVNIYSPWDYRYALSIVPICLALSVIVLRFVKETHHKSPLSEVNKGAVMLSDVE